MNRKKNHYLLGFVIPAVCSAFVVNTPANASALRPLSYAAHSVRAEEPAEAFAEEAVEVVEMTEAGKLKEKLGEKLATVKSLKVKGPINVVDLRVIKTDMTAVESVDLEDANIQEHKEGTSTYAANEIGGFQFSQVEKITKFVFPKSLKTIGRKAFMGSKLKEVILPEGLETLTKEAFQGSVDLKKVVLPGSLRVVTYSAFSGCKALESLTLNEGIQEIESTAFKNCNALTAVSFPSTITKVQGSAFNNCKALKEVTSLATTPPSLEASAFAQEVFDGAKLLVAKGSLDKYRADEKWNKFKTIEEVQGEVIVDPNQIVAMETAGQLAIKLEGKLDKVEALKVTGKINAEDLKTMKEMVKLAEIDLSEAQIEGTETAAANTIGEAQFSGKAILTRFVFPMNLVKIEKEAFKGTTLAEVALPETLTDLGESAFMDCAELSGLTLPASLSTLGSDVIKGCPKVTILTSKPTTPPTATAAAFEGLYSTLELRIPAEAKAAYKAHEMWSKFTNVKDLEGNPISEDPAIFTITMDEAGKLKDLLTEDQKNTLTAIKVNGPINVRDLRTLKKELILIEKIDLADANIEAVTIGEKEYPANSFEESQFEEKRTLKYFIFPKTIKRITANAFKGSGLVEAILPEGLEMIDGIYAFAFCSNLTKASIPASLKVLPAYTFVSNANLQEVTFKAGLEEIQNRAFSGCKMLSSVSLPETLKSLEGGAFKGCVPLTELTLPASLQKLGKDVVKECPNLTKLVCLPTTPPEAPVDAFEAVLYQNLELRIPKEAFEAYDSHAAWSQFRNLKDLEGKPLAIDNELSKISGVRVAGNVISIEVSGMSTLVIYDVLGREIYPLSLVASKAEVNVKTGAYIVVLNGKATKVMVD